KKDSWHAYSAGVQHSRVHPLSIAALQELGIDTKGLYSKGASEFLNMDDLDLVITVCDHARQTCPVFPKPIPQIHIGIDDPVGYSFESAEIALERFRDCRNDIMSKIVDKLDDLQY
ncbi:MAG: arsenate reductase ArsC, partial [Candidatus Cloacimonetes bacterium]|nr:arsenate reductase ArsC [Candidatus Cloacimonadota bacterium]